MSGFDPYLAEVAASMQGPLMSPAPPSPGPLASVAPPMVSSPNEPLAAPAALPNPNPAPPVDPMASHGPPASIAAPADQAPPGIAAPPPDVNAAAPAPAPGYREPNAGEFPLTMTQGGGVTPAHEVDLRGPSLKAAQQTQNDATSQAIVATATNSVDTAGQEFQRAQQQERDALMRQAENERATAELADEANRRQADFDQTSKQLANFAWKPDGGYWSNRSVPQKIMSMVGMAIAGFGTPVGGRNPAYDAIMQEIDHEVKNQENQYRGLTDAVGAKQTAFSQAMNKYNNVNAARSMARASALDAIAAQSVQTAALWKGTDAANKAITMGALATADRTAQIQQGVRFVLPQALGKLWVDRKTGLSYTEQQAHEVAKEFRAHEQKREEIGLNTAGDIAKEQAKGAIAHKNEQQYGPMGKAGAEKLATERAAAQQEVQAAVHAIGIAKNSVDQIVGTGTISNAYAEHAPSWAPGATGAKVTAQPLKEYNARVMLAIGAAYKLSTDAMEPKNLSLIKEYADKFEVLPSDNRETALVKMNSLEKFLNDSAEAKGATGNVPLSADAEESLQLHGGK